VEEEAAVRVLVTGAGGFIGKHLVNALMDHKHQVTGLDNRPGSMSPDLLYSQRWYSDITELNTEGPPNEPVIDACIHLAAIASPPLAAKDPARAFDVNVRGTQNVLQLCQRIGCPRVVFFSSAHVYGISPKWLPTNETHPLWMQDTYTTSKILGEQLMQLYWENHGLSYCTLRLSNAYGPNQSSDYFIGAKLKQAREGKLTLRNGGVTKDWIHVSDVSRAAIAAIGSSYVGPINIGTGVETPLGAIVGLIGRDYGIPIEFEDVQQEGPTRMAADWRRAKQVLGWEPQVSFRDGLKELIELNGKVAA
jgi:UDP-glucose 4-epimerase